MAVGLSAAVLNSMLNGLCRATAWTVPVAFYVKLHLGDPGSAGTANAAANTLRKVTTFSASSGGIITTSADLAWTSVPNAETYSHLSFWDAVTAGTFQGSSTLTVARTVAIGDNFTVAAGSLVLSILPVAA